VIRSKQHLAVVLPCGPALVLNLLRWGGEIRSWQDLPVPPEGKAGVKDAELKMARQLIESMSGHWSAEDFRDDFHDAIMKLVEAKAKAGATETVAPLEEAPPAAGADVIDLTELLRRSLRGNAGSQSAAAKPAAKKTPAKKTATRSASRARGEERERAVAAEAPRKRAAKKTTSPARKTRARRAA
jgi:DNA end-binding protein Ku